MALSVYKRGDFYWVRGTLHGRPVRHTLDTRNRHVAHRRAAELELGTDAGLEPMTIAAAGPKFLAGYQGSTRRRHSRLLRLVQERLPERTYLHEITPLDLDSLIHRGARSPNTIRQEVSALRVLFGWAVRHKVCRENPAAALRLPAPVTGTTEPLTDAELAAIENAIAGVGREPSLRGRGEAAAIEARAWAMYQVLRTTGIRVSDLVKLRPEHIRNGMLRTQKTKATVPVRLPQVTLDALKRVPAGAAGYYFWSGESYKGACDSVWRTFSRLGRRAGIARLHPHRLRDTFAVNLLAAGADLRLVSKLLGHDSIRTTEKHYAPWVQAFQDQADKALAAAESRYRKAKTARSRRPAGRAKSGRQPRKRAQTAAPPYTTGTLKI